MHWIAGIIGLEATFRASGAASIGNAPRAALADGWAFVPLDGIVPGASTKAGSQEIVGNFEHLTHGLIEALTTWSQAGGLAYVETQYWGGSGGQGAAAAVSGKLVYGPAFAPKGPINTALELLGLKKCAGGPDAFDLLGLGTYRDNSDFSATNPNHISSSD